jgi:hypothetical protein
MYTSAHDAGELASWNDIAECDFYSLDAIDLSPSNYLPAQVPYADRKFLSRPLINQAYFVEPEHFQLKIQPFKSGGYEGTVRLVNLQRIADLQNIPRRIGKREEPEERSQESLERSRIRARQKVRHHAKNIAANRLLTLTKRETEEMGFSTPDEWQQYWAGFCRVYKKYFPEQPFMFVAVLEQHKDGKHFHLHIATYSKHKMPLEVMRGIWWGICGGRGMGNVDIRYIRQKGHHGTARIAKYLSKYISKGFDCLDRFNKKRYWVSDRDLPEAQRMWLRSRTVEDAISEVFERSCNAIEFGRNGGGFFIFPDQSGFWFAVHPGQGSPPPF